jgi:FAD/FMN-containing dehydrogenase
MSGTFDVFRASFPGKVLLPGDADYDVVRGVWNGAIDRRPALIARCTTAAEVGAALAFGRQSGLTMSIRGGGHNFAGSAVCEGGLMIDLGLMKGVRIDAEARRARVGGGATWADLDAAAQQHGLAVPGGFISHTGIGGLTLGGGVGWLTKTCGLSIDNLIGAEVVTADSRTVRASEDENPDLFWALRGGGGNFGVVTEFEYRLNPVGPMVNLGLFFYELERGAAMLKLGRELVRTLPAHATPFLACLNAPPAPFVPEADRGRPGYALLIMTQGAPEDHAALAAQVRATLTPLFELVTPIPFAALQQMFDPSAPWGILGYEKALYLDELSDAAIDVITAHFPRKASPMSFVPMFTLDGAYRAAAEDATAFSGPRSARYLVNIAAVAPDRGLYDADVAWSRAFWEALRPHAVGPGSYVNFIVEDDQERVRASYGAAKYDRLARIKAEWDPDNVFRHNANIKPAAGGGSAVGA